MILTNNQALRHLNALYGVKDFDNVWKYFVTQWTLSVCTTRRIIKFLRIYSSLMLAGAV